MSLAGRRIGLLAQLSLTPEPPGKGIDEAAKAQPEDDKDNYNHYRL
jgi:hypothetical protein